MARRLLSRRYHQYLFTSPHKVNEETWREDVEQMALVEEARQVEARLPRLREQYARAHVPQWGRETENALRGRLWIMLRLMEEQARYGAIVRHMRRLRGL